MVGVLICTGCMKFSNNTEKIFKEHFMWMDASSTNSVLTTMAKSTFIMRHPPQAQTDKVIHTECWMTST